MFAFGDPSLREAWDAQADEWVRWSRSPHLDHAFWRMNLPTMLSLLPSADGLVVDVGCGEGRVARALKERGYRVVGIEGSAALVRAAREADPEFPVEVGDAAKLPFADSHFSLAVASLSLMNMDDLPAVIREVARVLQPGSCFCFSVLHPFNTWGDAKRGYFETVRYSETLEAEGARLTVHDTHRPLHEYFDRMADAGFVIERLIEPVPTDGYLADFPAVASWRDRPAFLHARAMLR